MKIITFFKTLNRDAALDSFRNVLCFIGAGCVLAHLGTMPVWYAVPAGGLLFGVWALDYYRHDFAPHLTAQENAEACRMALEVHK